VVYSPSGSLQTTVKVTRRSANGAMAARWMQSAIGAIVTRKTCLPVGNAPMYIIARTRLLRLALLWFHTWGRLTAFCLCQWISIKLVRFQGKKTNLGRDGLFLGNWRHYHRKGVQGEKKRKGHFKTSPRPGDFSSSEKKGRMGIFSAKVNRLRKKKKIFWAFSIDGR